MAPLAAAQNGPKRPKMAQNGPVLALYLAHFLSGQRTIGSLLGRSFSPSLAMKNVETAQNGPKWP